MNYIKLFVTVFAMALALNASAQSKTTAKSKTAAPAKTTTTAAPKKTTTTTTARTTSANDRPSATRSSNKGYDPDVHFMLETRIGSGLGENLVLEKEFHKYVAVDFFSLGYTSENWKFDTHKISLKTGARGFSPRWWGGRMRAYTDLALGYDCVIFSLPGFSETSHGFGLTWGLGIHMLDHFYFGYSLDYTTISMNIGGIASVSGGATSHFFKFGYRF